MDKEDKATREERCKKLWQELGAEEAGTLNINGLKKGLDQLDHRELERAKQRRRLISSSLEKRRLTAQGGVEGGRLQW